MDANFIAVKIGDVNNSIQFSGNKTIENRSRNSIFISSENVEFGKGELVSVPFKLEKDVVFNGMQFTVNFDADALLFEGVDGNKLVVNQENFALLNNIDGALTFSFSEVESKKLQEGDLLFTIYFEARSTGSVSDMIDLNSTVTKAEIYTNDKINNNLEFVIKNADSDMPDNMEVYQNEPNPFESTTSIAFSIPQRQKVKLTVFDANGRVLLEQQKEFSKGLNEFVIESDQLDATGLLLYRIESGVTSVTRKMIMLK
jgi:hypothetical protein